MTVNQWLYITSGRLSEVSLSRRKQQLNMYKAKLAKKKKKPRWKSKGLSKRLVNSYLTSTLTQTGKRNRMKREKEKRQLLHLEEDGNHDTVKFGEKKNMKNMRITACHTDHWINPKSIRSLHKQAFKVLERKSSTSLFLANMTCW